MELSLPSRGLPTLLPNRTSVAHRSPSLLLPLRSLSSPKTLGLRCRDARSRAMEEASTFVTEKLEPSPNDIAMDQIEAISEEKEEAVDVVDGEQSQPAEFLSKLDIKVDSIAELPLDEATSGEKEEAVAVVDGEQSEPMESLSKLDIKLDSDNTYSLLVFGTGALLALWLSSAVVSSIDSIPLFPKVMEVVGLAYTVWFSYRYLIFKENRDELLTKIEDIKNHIIGTTDD